MKSHDNVGLITQMFYLKVSVLQLYNTADQLNSSGTVQFTIYSDQPSGHELRSICLSIIIMKFLSNHFK